MELHHRRQSNASGSQESLKTAGTRQQADNISVNSLTEFERLERDMIEASRAEERIREQEAMLSEIDEGHESQVSESDSCETLSEAGRGGRGDGDDEDEDDDADADADDEDEDDDA